jgi:hypothetical protein
MQIRKKGDEIKKKSSPLKLQSQSQPNFVEMIIGWSSSKVVSGISEHRPRWPPEVGITRHKFGRGPSKDHSTKVWLQFDQWSLRRRF